jgi:hypothetical protein
MTITFDVVTSDNEWQANEAKLLSIRLSGDKGGSLVVYFSSVIKVTEGGTRKIWSSFSSLNVLPVLRHNALWPCIAVTCGGIERPRKKSVRLCLLSGPWSR